MTDQARGGGHTPGPWLLEGKIENHTGDRLYVCEIGPAVVNAIYRGPVCHIQSCDHMGGISRFEAEANARLIAAAPDLLEACEALVEGMQSCGVDGPYLQQAISAIARAKGEA